MKAILIIICGLQGSGKTTIAARIAKKINAMMFRSDTICKQLFDSPAYSAEENTVVYNELLKRARENILQDKNVVLDATFPLRVGREHAREMAEKKAQSPFSYIASVKMNLW